MAAGNQHPHGTWPHLLRDPFVCGLAASVLLLVFGQLLLPGRPPLLPKPLSSYGQALLLLLSVVALFPRPGDDLDGSRTFWRLLTVGLTLRLSVQLLYILLPPEAFDTLAGVFVNCLVLLFFLGLFLAAEYRPDRQAVSGLRDLAHRADASAAVLFVFAGLVYFVLVPSALNRAEFESWLPSLYLFAVLNLLVAARFAQAARRASSPKWRAAYRLLQATADIWFVLSLLEFLTLPPGPLVGRVSPASLEPLGYLPFVPLIASTRLRRLRAEPAGLPDGARAPTAPEALLGRRFGPLVLYALALPVLHLTLYGFGVLDPGTRSLRDLMVLLYLVLLGGLALIRERHVESRHQALEDRRRKAEESLRLLESACQTLPLGLSITGPGGSLVYLNPAQAEMHGFEVEELLGQEAKIFAPASRRQGPSLERVAGGRRWRRESTNVRRDGSLFPVQLISRLVRNSEGEPIAEVTSCEDISERKAAEERLRQSEDRYRRLVESLPDGIFVEQGGEIVYANAAGLELLGPGSDAETRLQLAGIARFLAEERLAVGARGESRLVRAHGKNLDIELARIDTTYRGAPARQLLARDITETKRLRRKAQRVEHLAALGQMSATLAHEIRNPLGALALNLRYLGERLPPSEERGEAMADMFEAVERLQRVIKGILDFSRPLEPELTRVGLGELVRSCVRAAEKGLAEAGIELHAELRDPGTEVLVDPPQMVQVFSNLFENARQAMTAGGRIAISTRVAEGAARISIADTGAGIPEEHLGKIFDPFFTSKAEGIGLGLSIVARILEQHDGRISVASQVGEGTRFNLTLPLAPAADPALEKGAPEPSPGSLEILSAEGGS